MARASFGTIESTPLDDGSMSVRGRFRYRGGRYRVAFGRDTDGWTDARARRELENIRVLLRAGMPVEEVLKQYEAAPAADSDADASDVSFHEYASEWFRRRCRGELGDRLPSEKTREHYMWGLSHLLPFFARKPVARITKRDCERFRGKLFADSEALRTLIEAGGKPTYENGQPRKPLSPRSILSIMVLLGQILEDAVDDELRPDNPARSKRLRVRVPKPKRTFLEIDQLVALLDAARELERTPISNSRAKLTQEQAEQIRARLARGETQYALRREFRLSSAAMSMLAQGKTYRGYSARIGWRALCAVLGYAGPRISEALALLERDVRLHDPKGSRLWIPDSKTETGIRHVEITPALRDELLAYRAEKTRRGYPMTPETPLFCTPKGTPWNEDNVRQHLISPVVELASRRLVKRGLPPLPHITPHSLRRTYVSIMLLATNFDIPYVQSQVGHAHATMTLDVYNQLLDRSKRQHGAAFDALLSEARSTLYGPETQLQDMSLAHPVAHLTKNTPASGSATVAGNRRFAGNSRRVSEGTRTPDRLDHNQELYQLSYAHHGLREASLASRHCSFPPRPARSRSASRRLSLGERPERRAATARQAASSRAGSSPSSDASCTPSASGSARGPASAGPSAACGIATWAAPACETAARTRSVTSSPWRWAARQPRPIESCSTASRGPSRIVSLAWCGLHLRSPTSTTCSRSHGSAIARISRSERLNWQRLCGNWRSSRWYIGHRLSCRVGARWQLSHVALARGGSAIRGGASPFAARGLRPARRDVRA